SPSPSPSPSVSPSPSPEPDKALFVIRKYKDDDKDGVWDSNEGSTGQAWQFQYKLNDGNWQDYWTNDSSGWGGWITVNDDTKVEVKEIEKSDWVNTTGLVKIEYLDEGRSYYFDFGNYPKPGVVVTVPPVQAPEAGGGFAFWPVAVVIFGVALQILAVLL
ncbi:MAG: hypothetical protein ABII08_01080, partial [Candidatus Beckwithbacteria bacterium]